MEIKRPMNIESIQEYKYGEDWTPFSKNLEHYVGSNSIDNDRKVVILLAFIDQETYNMLKNHFHPTPPKDKKYEDLNEVLIKKFSLEASIFHKRSIFYDSMQEDDEAVVDWYLRIKSLAEGCEFGEQYNDKLKDRFITGLQKGQIFERLCKEDYKKNLKDLVDTAVKTEIALKLITVIEKDINKMPTFNKDMQNLGKSIIGIEALCRVCGKENHNCKLKHVQCNICKKAGKQF